MFRLYIYIKIFAYQKRFFNKQKFYLSKVRKNLKYAAAQESRYLKKYLLQNKNI